MTFQTCAAAGGQCVTEVDGFFVLVVIGALIALYWKVVSTSSLPPTSENLLELIFQTLGG